ncbi:probable rRNA-processing protein EBP2 [Corticium candelabrum]|uniref:probable rRNA-processing protein EBP2 n=1 Tax=Corticium candelabrum TaxID=121492 RepID=UPI002E2770FF|nr:probable rRNA-processing protein EBP2 [Corticium candelabrum]
MNSISEESESDDQSVTNSDDELRKQFASGVLKPGLNIAGFSATHAKKICINNIGAMQEKLTALTSPVSWLERLDVASECHIEQSAQEENSKKVSQIHDDFNREMAFYKQALAAVQVALPQLHDLDVTTQRPGDYFAEMVKSDDHMKKVREKLLVKEKAIERSEKARKLREIRKYGKKVQRQVLEQRQKEKKEAIQAVKKYRKGHQQKPEFLKNDSDEFGVTATTTNQAGDKQKFRKSNKRKLKDKKFGLGGKKRGVKRNSAVSSADMSGFKSAKHSVPSRKARKALTSKPKRPGKSRRARQRQK